MGVGGVQECVGGERGGLDGHHECVLKGSAATSSTNTGRNPSESDGTLRHRGSIRGGVLTAAAAAAAVIAVAVASLSDKHIVGCCRRCSRRMMSKCLGRG